ncbi:uncharacterized protein [Prorops nasuta]
MELPENNRESTKMCYDQLEWLKAEERKYSREEVDRRYEWQLKKARLALHLRKQRELGNIMENDYLKIYKEIPLTPIEEGYVFQQYVQNFRQYQQLFSSSLGWKF